MFTRGSDGESIPGLDTDYSAPPYQDEQPRKNPKGGYNPEEGEEED